MGWYRLSTLNLFSFYRGVNLCEIACMHAECAENFFQDAVESIFIDEN